MKTEAAYEIQREMNVLGGHATPFLFIIDFLMQKPMLYPLHDIAREQILYNFCGQSNAESLPAQNLPPLQFEKFPLNFSQYKKSFNLVMENLRAGNSFLVNLTLPTPIAVNRSLKQIYHQSQARYKLWYQDEFVVFSPETFIKIDNGVVSTYPMKGTIDSSLPGAEQKLLADPKELAEHVTIVDLLRNDLSQFATGVEVKRFRFVEELTTYKGKLLQVSSEVSGKLPANYPSKIGDIIMGMLPAGSVSGAPKPKTLQIIQEAEGYERGYYTGVMGIFDGVKLDSAVMIRYIEHKNGQFIYKSGGGITAQSIGENEYQELIDKVYVPFT